MPDCEHRRDFAPVDILRQPVVRDRSPGHAARLGLGFEQRHREAHDPQHQRRRQSRRAAAHHGDPLRKDRLRRRRRAVEVARLAVMAVGDEALEGADPDRLALAPAAAVLLARVVADAPDARRQRAQVHDLLERGEKTPLADVGHVVHAGQVRRARLLARRTRLDLPAGGIERGDDPDQRQRADGHPAPERWARPSASCNTR